MRSENPASLACKHAALLAPEVVRAIRKIRGFAAVVDADAIRGGIEACVSEHPLRPGTRRQAVVHEAGHLIGFEFEDLIAGGACVNGPPFGRGGWGGEAWRYRERCIEHGPWANDPLAFIREATGRLAGPIAEEVLGDGHALTSIRELIEAKLLTARAAELSGRDGGFFWHAALLRTAAIVERHANEIEEIAEMLMHRKRVNRDQPSMRRILERVRPALVALAGLSTRSTELVRLIETAVPSFDALLEAS
jgi:hypothetical protein